MKDLLINRSSMSEINFNYNLLTEEETRMFVGFIFRQEDIPNDDEDLINYFNGNNIGNAVKKRHTAFKEKLSLPEIENRVIVMIDLISKGNIGKGILMLVDLCGKCNSKKITMDTFTNVYPEGFYSDDTFRQIIDKYMKPGKIKFSEMYNLR